jgi:ribosomal protein S18 acetylase RimI-like enzyme
MIRPARSADCAAVAAMVRDLASQAGVVSGTTPETLAREAFGSRPTISILVVEEEGRLIGFLIHQDTFSTWRGQNGVFVVDFYIAPGHRGRGIGRELIAELARIGWDRGARFVRLDVEDSNEPARRLYARLGFRDVDLRFLALDEAGMARLAGS